MMFTIVCAFCNHVSPGPNLANQDVWRCPSCGNPFKMPEGWTIERIDAHIERARAHRDAQWDAHNLEIERTTGRDMSGFLRRHGMPWRLNPDGTMTQCAEGTLTRKPAGIWVHVQGSTWRPGRGEELKGWGGPESSGSHAVPPSKQP